MRSVLIAFFSWLASWSHAAQSTDWLVVEERMEGVACCSFNGTPDAALTAKNIRLVFTPSEVVSVIRRDGNRSLVRGYASDISTWINNSKLLAPISFRPSETWNGQSRFQIFSASVDSGQTYTFASDGTFTASFDDNHKPRKWSGRLHRYKNLIWAKPRGGDATFDAWSVFQLKEDGTACILYFDAPPGVQCVGSME